MDKVKGPVWVTHQSESVGYIVFQIPYFWSFSSQCFPQSGISSRSRQKRQCPQGKRSLQQLLHQTFPCSPPQSWSSATSQVNQMWLGHGSMTGSPWQRVSEKSSNPPSPGGGWNGRNPQASNQGAEFWGKQKNSTISLSDKEGTQQSTISRTIAASSLGE